MTVDHGRRRPRRLLIGAVVAVAALGLAALGPRPLLAHGQDELLVNPGLERIVETGEGAGFPDCWATPGWGDHDYRLTPADTAHGGRLAMTLQVPRYRSGDRRLAVAQTPRCAPAVSAGQQYDLSLWYRTSTPATVLSLYRHTAATGWSHWIDLANLPVSQAYRYTQVRTPQVPPGTDRVSWGAGLYGPGTLTVDDHSMVRVPAPPAARAPCTGEVCTRGSWQVSSTLATVRAIHAVLLHTGKVLLIAGSGNDAKAFAAGTFKTTVYDPVTGSNTAVPTPVDLFCAGHAQLPDGRVLVMGGTKSFPKPGHDYQGLRNSYLFDPATNRYQRVNDMIDGHWYPSATALGNGDVLSLGGQNESGTVISKVTEYYSYAQRRWLAREQVKQTGQFWGNYPTLVLLQDGRLFYTGSHVFGGGFGGTGAYLYDYAAKRVTEVPGLREKDFRDQSMSVLLPPAQEQRVMIMGGGDNGTNRGAIRLTDIIDLKQATPAYQPGPNLPYGRYADGTSQTGNHGKFYVSAVLLPDGRVLETGGALHTRAKPVFGASIYDPVRNTFTPMAADPVARNYHSSSFLLPDGRVMSVGSNPADGSFDQRISFYSPPYLFAGSRPAITSVTNIRWPYGSTQQVNVDSAVVRAALVRPSAVTHSSDPNQRYVDLPMRVRGSRLDLSVPNNPNLAPPGWYLLSVVRSDGVPAPSRWVRVG